MDDLIYCIDFNRNGKKIWSLRCDKKTFLKINDLVNFYLVRGKNCD